MKLPATSLALAAIVLGAAGWAVYSPPRDAAALTPPPANADDELEAQDGVVDWDDPQGALPEEQQEDDDENAAAPGASPDDVCPRGARGGE
jgi:hypothetical protein